MSPYSGGIFLVTIKQIADLCGVSRGTVDRVLNDRGNVKAQTRELVLNMAKQVGYKPNPAGKALAARKHHPVVGIILPSKGNPFFDEVINGLKTAATKYEIYGLKVLWKNMHGYDTNQQCQIMEEMKGKINALIISPIDAPCIIDKINEFVRAGILVITLNTDVNKSNRHCYVGSDYLNGGETAGALLPMIMPSSTNIGVIMGSSKILGHRQRLAGFKKKIEAHTGFNIIGIEENDDDDIISYDKTKALLENAPQTNALFIVAAGVYGACRAVLSLHKEKDITIIAFDTVPTTIEMMRQNIIKAAIYQHPYRQGQRSMQLAFDYLVNGIAPERKMYIMKNEIKIVENL